MKVAERLIDVSQAAAFHHLRGVPHVASRTSEPPFRGGLPLRPVDLLGCRRVALFVSPSSADNVSQSCLSQCQGEMRRPGMSWKFLKECRLRELLVGRATWSCTRGVRHQVIACKLLIVDGLLAGRQGFELGARPVSNVVMARLLVRSASVTGSCTAPFRSLPSTRVPSILRPSWRHSGDGLSQCISPVRP
jgi:hypothetical protein